jgi:aminopeptidase N
MNESLRTSASRLRRHRPKLGRLVVVTLLTVAWPLAWAQVPRAVAPVLTMEHARERAARVRDVAYELTIQLDDELRDYSGTVVATFTLTDAATDLTLDFADGTVASADVNGAAAALDYNGFYITLPAAGLRTGRNRVALSFAHPYSSDGSGLYRFKDPEDGRDYLFTDFEPYNQNRLFPSFDQPDLKARYTLTVTAPATWHVITNVAEYAVTDQGGARTWRFQTTPLLGTYIFALHAGEYHVWESNAGDIPLRLFARESIARYVEPEVWFAYTRQGFEFFERYFDVPYPFGKYDQVIVPHFNPGAMENAAAVTFNELYVRRGAYTRQDRRSIASTLLHEMAHMWFGDLVTMEWWNGLWLNESFATFMSVLAMVEATEFTDEWLESYRDTLRAYDADERDTTHSIELPVPDTDSAFANFDRITYEKGSATLIQLNHLVGAETFRRGVSDYLKTHAYGNARTEDFLAAISAAAGQDLEGWAVDWLLEPGTNAVEVELECRDGRIASLALLQSAPPTWPRLRTHRAQLGLYDFAAGEVAARTLPVTYSGARTAVEAAAGQDCPDMIYANHGAWDYVRVRLAPDALPVLSVNLRGFTDPLARLMLWQSVWDMALDARLPLGEYLEFALANLDGEDDEEVERHVLGSMQDALELLGQIDAGAGLAVWGPRVEAYLWQQLLAAAPRSDRQLLMFDNYARAVTSAPGIERLAAVLTGAQALPAGLVLDQDRRWSVLATLAAYGHSRTAQILAQERGADSSDDGRRRALAVEVAPPVADLKRHWVRELLDPARPTTLAEFRAVAGALFPDNQYALQLQFTDTVLAALPEQNHARDVEFLQPLVRGLLRPVCSAAYLEDLDDAIDDSAALHPVLQRELKDARFVAARCLRIAAL